MAYQLPTIQTVAVQDKRVLLLADLDVPLTLEKAIEDDMRLQTALPTVSWLLEHNAIVVMAGKLGRPSGKVVDALSLLPVAEWFAKTIHSRAIQQKIGGLDGWQIAPKLFLLENLRFNQGEEKNDPVFAKQVASLVNLYVNDAFSLSHRNHASVVGVCRLLPHYAGFHLQKEVGALQDVLDNPKRPLVVIIGGKKIETKLPLVAHMRRVADFVLVGGKIAQEAALLPKDSLSQRISHAQVIIGKTNADGTDITEESIALFFLIIKKAQTIVWNGPMGYIPVSTDMQSGKDTERGTKNIAQAIATSGAFTVVGGGDTVEFLKRIGMVSSFDFVSTGGGAMLSFLSGERLPGLEALQQG